MTTSSTTRREFLTTAAALAPRAVLAQPERELAQDPMRARSSTCFPRRTG